MQRRVKGGGGAWPGQEAQGKPRGNEAMHRPATLLHPHFCCARRCHSADHTHHHPGPQAWPKPAPIPIGPSCRWPPKRLQARPWIQMAAPQRLPTPCQIQWIWASEAPLSPGLRRQKRTVAQSGRIPEPAARRRCSVFFDSSSPRDGTEGRPSCCRGRYIDCIWYPTAALTASGCSLLLEPLKS